MEGYTVISSKKVLLSDLRSYQLEAKGAKKGLTSPVTIDVIECPCSPKLDALLNELVRDDNDHDVYNQNNDNQKKCPSDVQMLSDETIVKSEDYITIDYTGFSNNSYDSTDPSDAEDSVHESAQMRMDSEIEEKGIERDESDVLCPRSIKGVPKESLEQYLTYLCPECGLPFDTGEKWRLHLDTEHAFGRLETVNMESIVNDHGKQYHKCRDCSKVFDITTAFFHLLTHRFLHMTYSNYICCRFCETKYSSKPSLRAHLRNKHYISVSSKFNNKNPALKHIRIFCAICKQELVNIADWRAHMRSKHDYFNKAKINFDQANGKLYKCKHCPAKVRIQSLGEHMLTHEEFKSFKCTFCSKHMPQITHALAHVHSKHLRKGKEILYTCSLCSATFKTEYRLQKHYKEEHTVYRATCQVCDKSFRSASLLLSHMHKANHLSLKIKN